MPEDVHHLLMECDRVEPIRVRLASWIILDGFILLSAPTSSAAKFFYRYMSA